MALVPRAGYCLRIAVPLLLAAGCSLPKPATRSSTPANASPVVSQPTTVTSDSPAQHPTQGQASGAVRQASHQFPAATTDAGAAPSVTDEGGALFAGKAELSLPELMREVESRNPSVQAMVFAWQAMAQRYPQAVSLDDPVFMTMIAPASFNSSQVQPGYIVSGSQKLPWFGKRDIRGQAAQAEASAAFHDAHDTRLQVAQVTRTAFYDYYVVEREAELITLNARVMQEFRRAAQGKYENNQVTQQDVLQADVELADTERRGIEIERMRRVARARLNTLLRRAPSAALPPPPRTLELDAGPPAIANLQQLASVQRPDLAALAARVRAEEAAVELAQKQYYPDAEFFGRYDSFWQPAATQSDLRAQVGMNMNVPIYRKKLQAAVCEAQFRLSQRRAEYQQRQLDIQYEVESAYEQVQESRRTAELYEQKFLPFAEQNLDVATSNYDVGKTNFLLLSLAQRQRIEVREKYQQTLADYHRRMAELERVVGGNLPK